MAKQFSLERPILSSESMFRDLVKDLCSRFFRSHSLNVHQRPDTYTPQPSFTMSLLWMRASFHGLLKALLESVKQLLPNIGALILAFLVWLELKTGLVLAFFALYDKHPHFIQTLLLAISIGVLYRIVRFIFRLQSTPKPADPFRSAPYRHRREETPMFPPGMEFNRVQERWKKEGMEKPFVEERAFGARRPEEVPPVRRPLFSVPTSTLPRPQSKRPPVNAAFGKAGWT